MNKKLGSVFLLLLSLAIFDNLVKKTTEFSVNLDVQYHSSWFIFALYATYTAHREVRNKFDKAILKILAIPFLLRLGLNLSAINQSYEVYTNRVSNEYIDLVTWIFLAIGLLILVKWKRYIV